jgi:hypothetical protein
MLPFDLHVLSVPPAFNLSQDQTLQLNFFETFASILSNICLTLFRAPTQFA